MLQPQTWLAQGCHSYYLTEQWRFGRGVCAAPKAGRDTGGVIDGPCSQICSLTAPLASGTNPYSDGGLGQPSRHFCRTW